MAEPSLQKALDPLWSFFTATVLATAATLAAEAGAPRWSMAALAVAGAAALTAGLLTDRRRRAVMLFAAGAALGVSSSLVVTASRRRLDDLLDRTAQTTLRIDGTVLEGWTASRWGMTTRIRVDHASHAGTELDLPRTCSLEVRNVRGPSQLPEPGAGFGVLADLRGSADRPLLVASSPSLITPTHGPRGVSAIRAALARRVLRAAGTDAGRIRAAELAAALALGRRDLMPRHVIQGWRDSGLGHALAVSGLHVGVVAGFLWLLGVAAGLRPAAVRWALVVLVPAYTVLAGAAPSAVRACLMLCLYLGARLAGRSAIALGTVLAAASVMLLLSPALVFQAGFQLTVGVTAGLVRWAPALAARLRGPSWLRGVVAVPVVAQAAAAPIVALHFHRATLTAAAVNLAVPFLLVPLIPLAVCAVAVAVASPAAAAALLWLMSVLSRLLWTIGGLGRHWTTTVGSVPAAVVVAAAVIALLTLRLDRWSRRAGVAWLALAAAMPLAWAVGGRPQGNRVELLPVAEGLAALVRSDSDCVLFDGGRYPRQAAELLAGTAPHRIGAVFVSHPDEDHAGGIAEVLRDFDVGQFAYPSWMAGDESVVPMLRIARERGTRTRPVARGSVLTVGSLRVTVVWPPAADPGLGDDNERSLVVKAVTGANAVVLTADIPQTVERRLARNTDLAAAVLTIPHHGSATSTSQTLLDAVDPVVALIPAGPANPHGHPHPSVLRRLRAAGIVFLYPARDGRCGVFWDPEGRIHTFTMAR